MTERIQWWWRCRSRWFRPHGCGYHDETKRVNRSLRKTGRIGFPPGTYLVHAVKGDDDGSEQA